MSSSLEIRCPSCNQETLLLREPVYEGFTKSGEKLSCSSCGQVFESEEEVPFVHRAGAKVFSDADRSKTVEVFREHEADALCRYCTHYVVNPFLQWCGLHKKEVEATDTCPKFERKPDPKPDKGDDEAPKKPVF